MPQLLPFYFVNQISFAFLLFSVLLYILSIYILPNFPLLQSTRLTVTKL